MLELEHGFRVLDVGATLSPGPESPGRGLDIGPERLERELHQAGVVRAAVAPPSFPPSELTSSGYLAPNNTVARMSVERPFIPFARLGGPRTPGKGPGTRLRNLTARRQPWHADETDVESYAYGDRFEGFVLDPTADGLPDEAVLATLAEVSLPVRLHAGRGFPPELVAETVLEYGFPTVLASFGGRPLDRGLMSDAVGLLDQYDHLYLDTAAVRYRDLLERTLTEYPDRVLFGSGVPDVHPSVGVMELLTLSVPESTMRRAFERNPSRAVPALSA